MAIAKTLAFALLFGLLSVLAGVLLGSALEKSLGVGRSAPAIVALALGCTGALLGGMAGAAQAILDSVTNKPQ